MEYDFRDIEARAKEKWSRDKVYEVSNDSDKPKYYVLDMFPYPSGAGLHVGHPLGYIASDIFARYKRLLGFNVLHPMGFDAFGLPAEQYALETGQHPAVTTEKNIARYREQLDKIAFSFDWSRQVRTSDPGYYKWTQWIFLQLFHSWYDRKAQKAKNIAALVAIFEKEGNINTPCPGDESLQFDSSYWKSADEKEQRRILMHYRLAYQGYAQVWWCEALGTVLANDEVVNGVSERGGFPVERKNMRQWFLRITEYADRLQESLTNLEWSEAMKEMQRNWIGKSVGAEVRFGLTPALSKGEGGVVSAPNLNPGWQTADKSLYETISKHQAELKGNPTVAESALWQRLRDKQLGVKFRRQHIVGKFIADFISLPARLIVEVDGKIHDYQQLDDAERTKYLEEQGFKVIRFTNDEVLASIDSVIEKIKTCIPADLQIDDDQTGGANNTSFPLGEGRDGANTQGANNTSFPLREGRDGANTQGANTTSFPLGEGRDAANTRGANNTSFPLGEGRDGASITVFTTRPDTIFGVDFMVLAPELDIVGQITTPEQKDAVEAYIKYVKSRSERERMSEVKQVTGCFTGAYATHPLTQRQIPIWISEYVLAGYGTGAIMAVPSGDDRDFAFAKHFNIPITNVFGDKFTGEAAYSDKAGTIENSDFLSGLDVPKAIELAIDALVKAGVGKRKVNYKLRDAGFSRQRYWGEPFPIVYKNDVPYGTDELPGMEQLPVELPHVEHYKPGPEGQGPLANIDSWMAEGRETNTMPGYAGSSWYFLRYIDPHNDKDFASRKAVDYWNQVDLYVGGTEHAVGHLLYSRMWTKALCDLGYIGFDEPFKRLLNQGMIQGSTRFVYRVNETSLFVSAGLRKEYEVTPIRVDVNFVDGLELDIEAFKKWRPEYADAEFILEDGKYICGAEVEKMSKSKYNVVNPDDIVAQYGADTFRMYEMFLGPIDISKPWDTKGIEGVHRFLKKFWRLYADDQHGWIVTDDAPMDAELKVLHKAIKKTGEDIERFSFNTAVSNFMITVNELASLNCHKRSILEPLAIIICPFAPHIAEEIWQKLGNSGSVVEAAFPQFQQSYVTENSKKYPVAINGKPRVEMEFPLDEAESVIEATVLAHQTILKWTEGKPPKKFIYVPGKMINVVI